MKLIHPPILLAAGITDKVSKPTIQYLFSDILLAAENWSTDYPGDECMETVIIALHSTVCSYEWKDLNIMNILKAIKILLKKINSSQRKIVMNKVVWQNLLGTQMMAMQLVGNSDQKVRAESEILNEEDDENEFSDWDESSAESISNKPEIHIPNTEEIKTLYTSLRDIEY